MAGLMDEEDNHVEEMDFPKDSFDIDFVCGDPQSDPRVGDEYQVEIPPMMSESERAALFLSPADSEVTLNSSHSFLVGLPVQIMWIDSLKIKEGDEPRVDDETIDINESLKSLKAKRNRSCAKNRAQSHENSEPAMQKKKRLNLEAVPGKSASSWEDNEVESFLLGLYTFGKDFVQVKKFMESKEMGEILLFYYGKFYKSSKYRSWSDSRKKRNRKCVCGRKLFSGWRQQELLSRLIPGISDESLKERLLDVSKSFAEGNVSLEKYVSSVKAIVGLRALVNAVAIGKEKEDLTVLAMEPIKTKKWFTVSSNAPAGGVGVYTSLTSNDIIKELTGGSRLSKARCNDIFWEAVWPRLLARGWHSEQPKDRGYVTTKDYLVFLVPGVRKFSRRKLVKGDHYFDSVSDILTKVVSEPDLLEFESKQIGANGFDGEEDSESSDQDSPSDKQRQLYLRSPSSNRSSVRLKFTVVDTSLAVGGKLCDVRELRTTAVESPLVSKPATHRGNEDSALRVPRDKPKLEKAPEIPLNVLKNDKRAADERKRERSRMDLIDDPMRFTIVDTSLDHGGKSSGLRKRRRLPVDDHPSKMMNTSDNSSDEHQESRGRVDVDTKPHREKSVKKKKTGSCEDPQESHKESESSIKLKNLEKNRDEKPTEGAGDDRSKKAIKRKFVRRTEPNRSALLKRRRLSACVKTELSRSTENFSIKPTESDQTSLCYPPSIQNATTEVHSLDSAHENGSFGAKNKEKAETRISVDIASNPYELKETKTEDGSMEARNEEKAETQISIDVNSNPDELKETETEDGSTRSRNEEKAETRFSIDMNSSPHEVKETETEDGSIGSRNKEKTEARCSIEMTSNPDELKGTEDGQCSSMEIQDSQETKPNGFCSMLGTDKNNSSKELGTTREGGSPERKHQQTQQQEQLISDVPRRQSTRKRPLTTRVLEAFESGFFSTTKRSKSPKPRKRANSLKNKNSNKAHNKVRAISEDETVGSRGLNRDLKCKEERNLLVKKATTSKPLDQIEDKKPNSEVPRLPPIVLKLSIKRG